MRRRSPAPKPDHEVKRRTARYCPGQLVFSWFAETVVTSLDGRRPDVQLTFEWYSAKIGRARK